MITLSLIIGLGKFGTCVCRHTRKSGFFANVCQNQRQSEDYLFVRLASKALARGDRS